MNSHPGHLSSEHVADGGAFADIRTCAVGRGDRALRCALATPWRRIFGLGDRYHLGAADTRAALAKTVNGIGRRVLATKHHHGIFDQLLGRLG
jgi:hypothetical protein